MNLQNYYETIMELSHGIVVTLDLDGSIIHGNSELESLSGYTMKELAGKDWFDTFIPPKKRADARQLIEGKTREIGIATLAGGIVTRTKETLYIDWNLKPLIDSNGTVISILCVGQDVTNHMKKQQGLLRERYSLIGQNMELSCLYEISLLMSNMDQHLDQILKQIVNLLPAVFQGPHKTHIRLSVDNVRWETPGYVETENTLIEWIIVNNDNRGTMTVSVENGPEKKARGATFFLENEKELFATVAQQVGIVISKKETRWAKDDLEQQLKQADRLAKIGQFSAGVAHEINEPLANILGFAELALQVPDVPEQVSSDLRHIVDSSLHAREVIKKLMFFSRQMPPLLVSTDLNNIINQALRITETAAKHAGINIQCELDTKLPRVMADPQHIKQVMVNLVANAIQAMEDGGTLSLTTLSNEDDAYIIVQDTGTGMAPGVLKQIFTPFFTTKDVDKGTGLGLSVVHGIVEAHKAVIQVQSTLGEGTRFELAFSSLHNDKATQ